jgi:hypothetical protein
MTSYMSIGESAAELLLAAADHALEMVWEARSICGVIVCD